MLTLNSPSESHNLLWSALSTLEFAGFWGVMAMTWVALTLLLALVLAASNDVRNTPITITISVYLTGAFGFAGVSFLAMYSQTLPGAQTVIGIVATAALLLPAAAFFLMFTAWSGWASLSTRAVDETSKAHIFSAAMVHHMGWFISYLLMLGAGAPDGEYWASPTFGVTLSFFSLLTAIGVGRILLLRKMTGLVPV